MRATVEVMDEGGVCIPLTPLDLPKNCPVRLVLGTGKDTRSDTERTAWLKGLAGAEPVRCAANPISTQKSWHLLRSMVSSDTKPHENVHPF